VDNAARQGVRVIFTIPVYILLSPEVKAASVAGHGHAHAVMGFLKAVYRHTVEKAAGWGEVQVMGDEAGGGLAYSLAVSLDSRSGLPAPPRFCY